MTNLVATVGIFLLFVVALGVLASFVRRKKPTFQYGLKDCIMTRAEHECYNALVAEMGEDYYFFPQVHLDSIIFPKGFRNDRFYAFRHINQKSVDFVACDKEQLRPLFALELDDKTHDRPERIERDKEVERILQGAGIRLIRIHNRGHINPKELVQIIQQSIVKPIVEA
jgi:very-short-patch-repair endonuclease